MLPSSGESSAESATVFWVVVGWWWPPWIRAWTNDRLAHRSHGACPNDFLVSYLHNSLAWGFALTPITPNTPTKSYCRCLLTYIDSLAFIPSNPPIPREPCFSRETAIHQLSHKKLLLSKSWSSHPRDSRWATICHHGWLIENSIFICIPWVSKEAISNIPWISIDESMIIPYYLHIHDDPNSFFSQPIECPAAVHASTLRLRGPCHPLRADRRWSRASRGGLGFHAPGDDFDQNRSRKTDFTRNKYLVIPSRNVMGITILGITILGDNMGRFTEKTEKMGDVDQN